ncbi:MAG TPA: hypothetical protein VGS22_14900 [Thermoanaerobaculia bacterium]|jgi:hypothetical protein|nr:hypothetical protein [Thermoanaerobaculia bacterium]
MAKVTVEEFMKNPTASLDFARAGETVMIVEVGATVAELKQDKARSFRLEPAAKSVADTGAQLVAYWKRHGLIGTRPDIADSQTHARTVRHDAERRLRSSA